MKNRHGWFQTDVGPLHIESNGLTDEVYLAHNKQKAFTVVCKPGTVSKFALTKEFKTHDQTEWDIVFAAYARWKRQQNPELFKLPNFSGRTKSGDKHPWRRRTGARRPPVDEEDVDHSAGDL